MAGASAAYLALAISLYRFGGLSDSAIVYANIANLTARIIYCSSFIRRLTDRTIRNTGNFLMWRNTIPATPVIVACLVAGLVTRFSEKFLEIGSLVADGGRSAIATKAGSTHLLIGIFSGIFTLVIW